MSKFTPELHIGLLGALLFHGALFYSFPVQTPEYEVTVAPMSMEISLVSHAPSVMEQVESRPPEFLSSEPEIQAQEVVVSKEESKATPELKDTIKNLLTGAVRDRQPVAFENPVPRYPKVARQKGYQGTVQCRVSISDQGEVTAVRILRSSGHRVLDRAATRAIKKWRFKPSLRFGKPVASSVQIPIHFLLEDTQLA